MTGWNRDYKNGYPQQDESGIPGQPGGCVGLRAGVVREEITGEIETLGRFRLLFSFEK